MLLAVLDRHAQLFVLDHDVFINVAGGLRLREPAADLAVTVAIASSHTRRSVAPGTLAIGEVGLTGELRTVPRLEARLAEAARLGLNRAIVPKGSGAATVSGLEVVGAASVAEAVELAF
jgi:DNA repair protein RadA/Sms